MDKKSVMTVLIIIIAIVIFIIVLETFFGPRYGYFAEKLDEEPDNYVNMSDLQMQQFPHLKEAILHNGTGDTIYEEYQELRNFLEDNDTRIIKYQYEYYKIHYVVSEGL